MPILSERCQQYHHCTDNSVIAALKQKQEMGVREEHSQDNTRALNRYQSFSTYLGISKDRMLATRYSPKSPWLLTIIFGNEERKGGEICSCFYQMYSSLSRACRNSKERQIKARKKKKKHIFIKTVLLYS